MHSLQLRADIQKEFKKFTLNVSLHVKAGCLGILGPSGSGKSITLQSIAGIVKPDRGRILLSRDKVGQRVLFDSKEGINLKPQQRRVGYLFQNYALFPNMTVEANIGAGLKDKSSPVIQEMIDRFQLRGLEGRYPSHLSGGQQQRVALARILAYRPEVLLFDEPFSAMDSHLKEELRLELGKVLQEYGGISVLVTHNRDEAYQLCDHLMLMDQGKILDTGETEALFSNPKTVQAAHLTGCQNISRFQRVSQYSVIALDWGGMELHVAQPVEQETGWVGIHAREIQPCGETELPHWVAQHPGNLIPVGAVQLSPLPFAWNVLLDNGLWWQCEKRGIYQQLDRQLPGYLTIHPESILVLSEESN